jgi:hypothetical protein
MKYAKWIVAAVVGLGALLLLVFTVGQFRIGPFAADKLKKITATELERTKKDSADKVREAKRETREDLDRYAETLLDEAESGATGDLRATLGRIFGRKDE